MWQRQVLLFGVGGCLLLSGCLTAQYRDAAMQLQASNPHAALEYAAKAVQSDPTDVGAQMALQGLVKAIASDHEARIALMRRDRSYEEAVAECDRVMASAHLVGMLPGVNIILPYDEKERGELAVLAADKHYQLGLSYEAQGKSRDAVDAYSRALAFTAAFKDAEKRIVALRNASTTQLFLSAGEAKEAEYTRQLMNSMASVAMEMRPRFLGICASETNASAKCVVSIEDASITDSGWVGTSLNNDTPESSWTDKKGVTHVTPAMHVRGMLYSRSVVCTASANFRVTSERVTEAQPSGTASARAGDKKDYAVWQGDGQLLPPGVQNLPQTPPALASPASLKADCVRTMARNLGQQLFLAYK